MDQLNGAGRVVPVNLLLSLALAAPGAASMRKNTPRGERFRRALPLAACIAALALASFGEP